MADPGLADELRQHAADALDLLQPWLDRVREQPVDEANPEPASCAACPVCAVITVLRGGRSELATRLAEQATELIVVLRAALAEGAGDGTAHAEAGGAGSGADAPARTVQRIAVCRAPSRTPC